MRTFIAIDLDSEIKDTLSLFIRELDKINEGDKNIKWISPEGMHLSLKFLGEIKEGKIKEIENVLREASGRHKPFFLKFIGTGRFPPGKKNPRVLWVGIKEEGALNILQSQLERELEKLGFPRENRKFHPHLTLGRIKIFSNLREVLSLFEHNQERSFGEMKAEKITFFRSILKPTGAEYSVLSEFELK